MSETLKALETDSWTDKCSPLWRREVSRQTQSLLLITFITQNLRLDYPRMDASNIIWLPDPRKIPLFNLPSHPTERDIGSHQDYTRREKTKPVFPLPTVNLASQVPCQWTDGARHLYPYSGPSWSAWFQSQAEEASRHIFEGEWVGYYVEDFYMSCGTLKTVPIQGIRFRKVEKHEKVLPSHLKLDIDKGIDAETVQYSIEAMDGGGIDEMGHFRLRGFLTLPQATIRLSKEHYKVNNDNESGSNDGGNDDDDDDDDDEGEFDDDEDLDIPNHKKRFTWDGRVTPLGICGIWHELDSIEAEPYGAVWLWKREWVGAPSL
ncbi:hypothetical protein BX600DRAFT_163217 [Xylariales sp. PMI_506]|nr:hypothetical protein BX600DRAFT_163217 [Xylariales sp. PMI_506]